MESLKKEERAQQSEVSSVIGYKIDTQKSTVSLYTMDNQFENKYRKIITLEAAPGWLNQLRI